ncbi:type II secretion system F family protein [Gammaproteobacteria bacterium]|nr:type II secretion system F family protein [Gammaproteobacteria bacterium]
MPAYSYTAFNNSGKKEKGFLTASSEREARRAIKELNLSPLVVKETNKNLDNKIKIKDKDLVLITRQIATLLDADSAIDEALKITADQYNNETIADILYNLRDEVIQGRRLGQAMSKYPQVFSDTYISLVTAGDSSGNLDIIFDNLADYLEESALVKQKIFSALAYPIILVCFCVLVIIALLAFVMPQVVGQFVKAGAELPFLTSMLLSISNNIVFIVIGFFLLVTGLTFLYKSYISDPENHIKAHQKILSLPLVGKFMLHSEIERFSSTMFLLTDSGMNLDLAMEESSKVIGNKYLKNSINKARKEVVEGKDFVLALSKTDIFPDIFIQLISSGYRSGNIVKMFKKVSDFMKSEIESKRTVMLSLLEPVITIFMGGFILLIVLAILIPIMQMNTLTLG